MSSADGCKACSPLRAGIELALPARNTATAVFQVPTSAINPANIQRIGPVTGNVSGRGGGGIEVVLDSPLPVDTIRKLR